ncbi:MAG TPA: type IV pilin protein [Nevskia sp.]|nr:type IV pilin protein [Nevskia sp.]
MRRCRQANRGFTLIELMTAAAVVAILAVFAMTAYFNAQRKGNRSAAEAFLASIAQQEQQFFIDNRSYLSCSAPITSATCALGVQAASNVYTFYTVSVTATNTNTPPTFVASAVPVAGTYQVKDSAGTLSINEQGNRTPSGVW